MASAKPSAATHAPRAKPPRGPAGSQEVGCATGAYDDRYGARLYTRRLARRPETNTAPRKSQVTAEVMRALTQRPDLRVLTGADGAPDNRRSLSETLPWGIEGLDFYPATEHRGTALGAAYGEGPRPYPARWEALRPVLHDDPPGVDKGLGGVRALAHALAPASGAPAGARLLACASPPDADLQALHLPSGSGVVAAAGQTSGSQRLQRAGMRWRMQGGQAMLTFRAVCQSERFARAWPLLIRQYQRNGRLPQKIIAFNKRR